MHAQRFVALERLKQRAEDTRLPDPVAIVAGWADEGGGGGGGGGVGGGAADAARAPPSKPLKVPRSMGAAAAASASGGAVGGGGKDNAVGRISSLGLGGAGGRGAAAASTSAAAAAGGWATPAPVAAAAAKGGALSTTSGGGMKYTPGARTAAAATSSAAFAYGRGGGAAVAARPASTLSLSWSEDSPLWDQVPLTPTAAPPRQTAASRYIIPDNPQPPAAEPAAAEPEAPSFWDGWPGTSKPAWQCVRVPPPEVLAGGDIDTLSPAAVASRCSGVASTSGRGRPPHDAAGRPLFLPSASSLAYLDGTLPGDFAFDPLGLFDPSNGNAGFMSQRWLHTSEVVHGRWAMLGAAGCLAPEYLAHEKVIPKATGVLWFKTGFLPLPGNATDFDYGVPLWALFGVQMFAMGTAESLRWAEYNKPGSLLNKNVFGLDSLLATTAIGSSAYPGGAMFNPLGLGSRPLEMRELQQSEVRHGRLAMLACLGYFASALVTDRGPYDNYVRHLDDPEANNAFTYLLGDLLKPPPVGEAFGAVREAVVEAAAGVVEAAAGVVEAAAGAMEEAALGGLQEASDELAADAYSAVAVEEAALKVQEAAGVVGRAAGAVEAAAGSLEAQAERAMEVTGQALPPPPAPPAPSPPNYAPVDVPPPADLDGFQDDRSLLYPYWGFLRREW